VNFLDSKRNTPLHWAALHKSDDCVHSLLRHNADPNLPNSRNLSPIHYAVENNDIKSLQYLIEYKADINVVCNEGYTPLLLALKFNSKNAVILLLENEYTSLNNKVKNKNIFDFAEKYIDIPINYVNIPNQPENKHKFNNQNQYDITFIVSGRKIFGTKGIIIEHCDYFKSLLNSNMKEVQESIIPIHNFPADIIQLFLEFLHIGSALDLSYCSLIDIGKLYEVSHIFFSPIFGKYLQQTLKNRLTIDNIMDIYKFAVENNMYDLVHDCYQFLRIKAVDNTDLLEIVRHYLLSVLNERLFINPT